MGRTKKSMDTLVPFLCTQPSEIHTDVLCCESNFFHCATVIQKALSIRNLPLQGTTLNYFINYFLHSIISVPSSKYLASNPIQIQKISTFRFKVFLWIQPRWRGSGTSQKQGKSSKAHLLHLFPYFSRRIVWL